LYAAMDQFEVDDLLSESLEEVGVDPGASLVEKVVEDEEEGEIILSGSRWIEDFERSVLMLHGVHRVLERSFNGL